MLGGLGLSASAAVIDIAPGNVTASSEIVSPFDRLDDYIVNGSGLTGGQHTGTVEPNMWLSTGTGFGGVDLDPSVTFDLGAVYTISSFQVWNYNENPPNLTSRGVNAVTVEFGTTLALGATVPGITNFAQANAQETYTGETFDSFTPFKPAGRVRVTHTGAGLGTSVVRVNAPDQPGLLSAICQWFAANGVSVEAARVATVDDQAEDVFLIRGDCDSDQLAAELSTTPRCTLFELGSRISDELFPWARSSTK